MFWKVSVPHTHRVNKATFVPCLSPDYIRGGCQGLCQGAEEQVQDQALLRQTPTYGLPACPDHPRGRQHGNVSPLLSYTRTFRKKKDVKVMEVMSSRWGKFSHKVPKWSVTSLNCWMTAMNIIRRPGWFALIPTHLIRSLLYGEQLFKQDS